MSTKRIIQFNKRQRSGIIMLISLIVVIQGLYFYLDFSEQKTYDLSAYERIRQEVDSLRAEALLPKKDTIYPFNPNYISDFKGASLGMSIEQIDRLLAYRKQGKFVNSAEEFQQITQIPDSLLNVISPSFRFPEWVTNKKGSNSVKNYQSNRYESKTIEKQDVNLASKEDLMQIRGIGQGLSERILEQRARVQGFSYMEQLTAVYGLDAGVIYLLNERFEVKNLPSIEKKNINEINVYDLARIPYLNRALAQQILILRSELGNISDFSQLSAIENLDDEKIKWIQLYLYIGK